MITKLEKLQRAVTQAQSTLDRLQADYKGAVETVTKNPSNQEAAIRAAALELQIKAVERALNKAQDDLKAERDRLESPEAVKALKDLDKRNEALQKKQAEIMDAIKALHEQFNEIIEMYDQAKGIAREYDREPFNWEKWGLLSMRGQIFRWVRMREAWERNQEIRASGKPAVTTVKQPDTKERRKMLNQRYGKEK